MKYDYSKFKSLEITQEEIDAIRKYISYSHTSMNSMLDLNPDVLSKLQNKAWLIDLSEEKIKSNIESFEKLYSAMYKYGKQHGGPYSRLYRGTSIDEIDRLNKGDSFGRFVSTSEDEHIAQRFTEYGNGAMISVQLGNDVPYLNMDEFLDDTQVSESEILLAPYCKVGEITKYSAGSEDMVRNYSMGLSKGKFENLTQEEKEKYEKMIYSFDLNKELEEYSRYKDEVETLEYKLSGLTPKMMREDPDLADYLRKNMDKAQRELSVITSRFSNIKNAMNSYLQDKFRTIELEIDKEIKKEEIVKDEEFRISKVEEFKQNKVIMMQKAEDIIAEISATRDRYTGQNEEELEMNELAKNTDTLVEKSKVEQETIERFETLIENIKALKEEISQIEIADNLTMEDMQIKGELMSKINEKYSQLDMTSRILADCNSKITMEKVQNVSDMQRKIADKVRSSIANKAITDLSTQRQALMTKKDSIIDKITGKSKLKKAQIENLTLKMQAITTNGLNIPNDIKGIETYLKKYSQALGIENLPKDAQVILKNSLKDKTMPELSEEDFLEFQLYYNPNMPTIAEGNTRKDMIEKINSQTQRIMSQSKKKVEEQENAGIDLTSNVDRQNIEDSLDMAIAYTNKDGRTMEQKREELRKNKTMDMNNLY